MLGIELDFLCFSNCLFSVSVVNFYFHVEYTTAGSVLAF